MKTVKFLFSAGKQATLLAFLILLSFVGCDDGSHQLGLPPQSGTPPSPPIVTNITNLPGAAIIQFEAPAEYDILTITAAYVVNDIEYEVSTSIFNNELRVEGFGTTNAYTVTLRTVNTSRLESTTVTVTVNPLTPPIHTIFESLQARDSWGGLRLSWENAYRNNIMLNVEVQDEGGFWTTVDNFFTTERYGRGTIRGLDPVETNYRITVFDRWGNVSDHFLFTGTPWREEALCKSRFREVIRLPGDAFVSPAAMTVSMIWSNDRNTSSQAFHTRNASAAEIAALPPEAPQQNMETGVTFDMGQIAELSRFRFFQRTGGMANPQFAFQHNNLMRYSMYGALEITPQMRATGSMAYWTHLVDVVAHRPSGNPPGGIRTREDLDFALAGEEIEFLDADGNSIRTPPVRFIRIVMKGPTWGGGTVKQIQEIDFWGDILETIN